MSRPTNVEMIVVDLNAPAKAWQTVHMGRCIARFTFSTSIQPPVMVQCLNQCILSLSASNKQQCQLQGVLCSFDNSQWPESSLEGKIVDMRCGKIVRHSVKKKLNISEATRTPSKTSFVGRKDAEGNLLKAGAKEEVGTQRVFKVRPFPAKSLHLWHIDHCS